MKLALNLKPELEVELPLPPLPAPLSLLHHFRPSRLLPPPPPPPLRLVFVGYNGAGREHGDGGPSRETFDLGSEAPSYGERGPLPPFLRRLVGCAYVLTYGTGWYGMVWYMIPWLFSPVFVFRFASDIGWYIYIYHRPYAKCRCIVFFFFFLGRLVRAYWYYTRIGIPWIFSLFVCFFFGFASGVCNGMV